MVILMNEDIKCFHCGLKVQVNCTYSLNIDNNIRFMCCRGCMFVAKFIIDNNFGEYYLYRTDFSKTADEELHNKNYIYDSLAYKTKFIYKKENYDYLVLAIDGITCAACTWLIEQHLKKMHGIFDIFVNLSTCRAHITFDLSSIKVSFILNELSKLGYKAYPYSYKDSEKVYKNEYNLELKKLIVAGIGMSQVMMLSASLYIGEGKDMHYMYWNFIRWINFFITTPVLIFSGWNIFISAFRGLLVKFIGMDFTISLSLILAYIASLINLVNVSGDVYFDSICMFIFFLLIGRFLEMRARHHSSNIVYSLQELTHGTANLFRDNEIIIIPIDDICINDVLVVKPGDIVPVDGEIIDGSSNFDESVLTGESLPINKDKGFNVIGGSTNITSSVMIKSTKNSGESIINAIIKLLNEAVYSKPKINIISDRVAYIFIIAVLAITFLVSGIWLLVGHTNVLNIALSMLVITCPCALSLATPIAITTSINFLTKHGFLITRGVSLEYINKITDIVFDKTGTLTLNEFVLDKIKLNANVSIDFVFSIAFLLEEHSEHPIAKAFLKYKFNKNETRYTKGVVKNYVNNGIEGNINGVIYRLGKLAFIRDWVKNYSSIDFDDFFIILADENNILAWFKLTNPLRKNAVMCISKIKSFNIETHILSGDSFKNVKHISDLLSIEHICSNASAQDKIGYIENLQLNGGIVMMVGDGINDTPALNISNVSIAMGSGVDLAKINADAILLNNDLLVIIESMKHCRKLKVIINQNICWAIIYNIVGLLLAGLNVISPYYAAIGMSFSSLVVVLNSMRLGKT